MNLRALLALAVFAVAGCGGGGVTSPGSNTASNAGAISSQSLLATPDARAHDLTSCLTSACIYVANVGSRNLLTSSVTVYAKGARRGARPIQTIAGSNTGLSNSLGIAVDAARNIYVVNYTAASIAVYAAGADGNVAPIRTISGSNTGLQNAWGIALDASGNLYVSTSFNGSVATFAPGADGNVSPIRIISGPNTGLNAPVGIALDASGKIYVADVNSNSVSVFAAGANGNVAPLGRFLVRIPASTAQTRLPLTKTISMLEIQAVIPSPCIRRTRTVTSRQ